EVGAQMDGVVRTILVTEGQLVKKGQRVAEMHCPELPAELAHAEALVEQSRQARTRVERGSREEERRVSEQKVAAARATLAEAKVHLDRMKYLVGHGALAQNQLDRAIRDHDVATARLNEAIRAEELVKAPALPEDIAKADAEILAARQRVDLVNRRIYKCGVGAPADGTILRVMLKPGESFSTINPRPIVTMADLSSRRVRAEIDEQDVAKIELGKQAEICAEGYRGCRWSGAVEMIYNSMGRKRVRSGDPSEKADRDVLEVLVSVREGKGDLPPVGLRVTTRFKAGHFSEPGNQLKKADR
ncbi:MAG: efflux RND transporter periplasmic adaptor subunit, partial [Bryobacterales bacterium]|nr:efflux RND transporter periplasmic adaptor subunit [Bryobacterales bacterium]